MALAVRLPSRAPMRLINNQRLTISATIVVMHGFMCLLSNTRRRASVEPGPRKRPRRGISRHPPRDSGPYARVAAPTCRVVHGTEPYGGGAVGTLRSADSGSAEAGIPWVRGRHVLTGRRCRRGTRCAPHSLASSPTTNGGRPRLGNGRSAPRPRNTGRHCLSTQDGPGLLAVRLPTHAPTPVINYYQLTINDERFLQPDREPAAGPRESAGFPEWDEPGSSGGRRRDLSPNQSREKCR